MNPPDRSGSDTPRPTISNRPGLPELAYRIGTHPSFLRRMLSGLPYQEIPDGPNRGSRPLASLTTRAGEDPAIALLDAWAAVADVLTFYQERIANEGFLRTAAERRSVLELARAIGYELNPGVAASTFLAFTVEDAPGAPGTATVPQGTRVQSIPGQGELPQTFETAEEIQAHAGWNALRPRLTRPQEVRQGITQLRLEGADAQLQRGDGILVVGEERNQDPGSGQWDFRVLQAVESYPEEGYTLISWEGELENVGTPPAENVEVFAFRQRAALFGHNAPDWHTMPHIVRRSYLRLADAAAQEDGATRAAAEQPSRTARYNEEDPTTWEDDWPPELFKIRTVDESIIDLDAAYPRILPGTWLVAADLERVALYSVEQASIDSRTDFALTSRITRLVLDTNETLEEFGLRETVLFAQSERLELADEPLAEPLHGGRVALDRLVRGLQRGRPLIVGGKRARALISETATGLSLRSADGSRRVALSPGDLLTVMEPPVFLPTGSSEGAALEPEELARAISAASGSIEWRLMDRDGFVGSVSAGSGAIVLRPAAEEDPVVNEVAFIGDAESAVSSDRDRTTVTLRDPLRNSYDRATVTINANIARATHGETVGDERVGREVLGSGDGAQANQRFALKKPPLTHVSAPTPGGAKSTLAVRVNGVLWQEVPSLFGLDERSQSYVVRTDGDGRTRVIFGDGEMGSRLPTGPENVTATYRSGIGLGGMVDAGKLELLQTRPLGIREVTNPLPATGAADPEALEDARANAPMTVATLDRIVSLTDFEDFARAFAGIGKVLAVALWNGEQRLVHITVAAANGDEVSPTSDLYANLVRAIEGAREPGQQVLVASYERRTFGLSAGVLVDARYVAEDVKARIRDDLLDAFGFERRELGRPVAAAEVTRVIQDVEGVNAVDLDRLTLDSPSGVRAPTGASQPPAVLPAHVASRVDEKTELLLLNPGRVNLEDMR
jgi:hypothetical protein